MSRKLKALGLALFATMALGAIGAQGAMGAELFHSEIETTYVTGVQENGVGIVNHFVLDDKETPESSTTFTCHSAVFEGVMEEPTVTSVTLTPTYKECTFGAGEPIVTHEKCNYILYAHTTNESTPETEPGVKHAPVELECAEGTKVVIHAGAGCRVLIPAQSEITHGLTYHNEGTRGERDITATITAHGIHWETENEFICTLGGLGAGSGTDATYTSSVTVKGYADAEHTEQVGIWHEEV